MRALFLGLSTVLLVCPARSDAEVVWVDANGRTIAPLVGEPSEMSSPGALTSYIDDAGLIWNLIPDTATVSAHTSAFRQFLQPDCTGPAYLPPFAPRRVFTILNLPGAWVRRDDVTSQVVRIASFVDDFGFCRTTDVTTPSIPESGLIAVDCTPPDLGACPPLHLERR